MQWAPAARGEVVLACTAPLWPCAGGRGPFGQEDTAPDTLFGKETVVFIFFVKKKKKFRGFFLKQALSFRRNLGMLLFKKKKVFAMYQSPVSF